MNNTAAFRPPPPPYPFMPPFMPWGPPPPPPTAAAAQGGVQPQVRPPPPPPFYYYYPPPPPPFMRPPPPPTMQAAAPPQAPPAAPVARPAATKEQQEAQNKFSAQLSGDWNRRVLEQEAALKAKADEQPVSTPAAPAGEPSGVSSAHGHGDKVEGVREAADVSHDHKQTSASSTSSVGGSSSQGVASTPVKEEARGRRDWREDRSSRGRRSMSSGR